MTQPTIKESLMCCITDGFKNQVDLLEIEKFRHFARLICEEMLDKIGTVYCRGCINESQKKA